MVFSAKRTDQIMALYIYIRWKIYLTSQNKLLDTDRTQKLNLTPAQPGQHKPSGECNRHGLPIRLRTTRYFTFMTEFMSNNKNYQTPGFSILQIQCRALNFHENTLESNSLKTFWMMNQNHFIGTVWLQKKYFFWFEEKYSNL